MCSQCQHHHSPPPLPSSYDFNKPDDFPKDLHHTFDMVVIDPPFITKEVRPTHHDITSHHNKCPAAPVLTLREQVWEKYAETAKLLLKEGVDSKGDLAFHHLLSITTHTHRLSLR